MTEENSGTLCRVFSVSLRRELSHTGTDRRVGLELDQSLYG